MDGDLNLLLIETFCQEVIEISTVFSTWERSSECFTNKSAIVEFLQKFCQQLDEISRMNASNTFTSIRDLLGFYSPAYRPNGSLLSIQDIFKVLVPIWQNASQSYYNRFRSSLRQAYSNVLSEFPVIYRVNLDSDITIYNENILPVHDHFYQIDLNLTRKGLMKITIRNSTLKNLHLNLITSNNSSVYIEENVFIGSGIKIIEEVKDSATSITMRNNIFRGIYKRPLLEIWNVRNISLKQNYFKNLQMIKTHFNDVKLSVGIMCSNSTLDLYDSIFKNVTLRTFIQLDNCSTKMDNVSFVKNSLTLKSSAVTMEKSNGTFSNTIFVDNFRRDWLGIWNGVLLLQNVSFSRNIFSSMATVFASHIVLINVTVEKNRGKVMRMSKSSVAKMSSCRWQENSGYEDLVHVSDSWMEIGDSLFESNYVRTLFDFDEWIGGGC